MERVGSFEGEVIQDSKAFPNHLGFFCCCMGGGKWKRDHLGGRLDRW